MKEKYFIKKLDQDDIMEIVTEYFLEKEYSGCVSTKACLLGVPGQDLRLIAVFSKGDKRIQCDFEDIDKTVDYNGSHAVFA